MLINVTNTIVLYLLIVNNAYPDLSYKRMNEANTPPPVDKTDKQKRIRQRTGDLLPGITKPDWYFRNVVTDRVNLIYSER